MGRRIAVIGGGPAAMATAFDLARQAKSDDQITVYQMGWRLGGKCAAGRDRDTGRLHEHGLHIFGGFYHRSFRHLGSLYDEWDKSIEFAHVTLPIEGCRLMDGKERSIEIGLGRPDRDREYDQASIKMTELVSALVETAMQGFDRCGRFLPFPLRRLRQLSDSGDAKLLRDAWTTLQKVIANQNRSDEDQDNDEEGDEDKNDWGPGLALALVPLREALKLFLRLNVGEKEDRDDALLALLSTIVAIGLIKDDLLPGSFDKINDQEIEVWLTRHGATKQLLNSPYIRASFEYPFAFEGGMIKKSNRTIAAGTALRGFINLLFTFHDSLFQHFNGPLSEKIFVPYYEALRKMPVPVRFAFFHRVDKIELDPSGSRVERITGVRQAHPKAGPYQYDPLDAFRDRKCWPDRPKFELLKNGDQLSDWLNENRTHLESDHTGEIPGETKFAIKRGAKDGFTHAVLAVPPAVVKRIARPLIAKSSEWAEACGSAEQIATVAVELRGTDPYSALTAHTGLLSTNTKPFTTWADMSFIEENEPGGERAHLSYLCGPWAPDPQAPGENWSDYYEREQQRASKMADQWVNDHSANILTHGMGRKAGDPAVEVKEDVTVRLNLEASEGYVLSRPGTIEKRLKAGIPYFENLYVAGDWTRTGLDIGSYESALMSGEDCAAEIMKRRPG